MSDYQIACWIWCSYIDLWLYVVVDLTSCYAVYHNDFKHCFIHLALVKFQRDANGVPDVICSTLNVLGATYANCDGRYKVTGESVEWAPERPVYKHTEKDRFIFWNAHGLGWSIGKEEYLKSGSHWHRSKLDKSLVDDVTNSSWNQPFTGGLDTSEPWQGQWNGGVLVECVGRPEQSRPEAQVNPNQGSTCCLLLPDIFIKTDTILTRHPLHHKRLLSNPRWRPNTTLTNIFLVYCPNFHFSKLSDILLLYFCFYDNHNYPISSSFGSNPWLSIFPGPVNCLWSGFGEWSRCSVSCGTGTQQRKRMVLQKAKHGGLECQGNPVETRPCSQPECPSKSWQKYLDCSFYWMNQHDQNYLD